MRSTTRCRELLTRGWRLGSDLEDQCAAVFDWAGFVPGIDVVQQARVGRFTADFAFPSVQLAVEVDGWFHRSPEAALRDSIRDAELRATGSLVLRIDDRRGVTAFDEQARQVARFAELLIARKVAIPPRSVGEDTAGGWTAVVTIELPAGQVKPDHLRSRPAPLLPDLTEKPAKLAAMMIPDRLGDERWAMVRNLDPPAEVEWEFQNAGWRPARLHRWLRSVDEGSWWGELSLTDGTDRGHRIHAPARTVRRTT